jgi:glycosyltransferase involved in cell wall biosynthesis
MSLRTASRAAVKPIIFASPGLESSTVQVAQGLAAGGMLQKWIVPFAMRNGSHAGLLARAAFALMPRLKTLLGWRLIPEEMASFLQCYPVYELWRIAVARARVDPLSQYRVGYCAELNFDRYVAQNWTGWTPIFYGCENSAVCSFQWHRRAGGLNLLWQVIAHRATAERVLEREFEKFPTLRRAFDPFRSASQRTNERKDDQIRHTDLILANSAFVRRTFLEAGVAPDRVVAVPTPCPPLSPDVPTDSCPARPHRPLIFLNAGALSVRKGVHLLVEAWRRLAPGSAAELWLVGDKSLPEYIWRDMPANVVVRPRVPRTELSDLFRRADVFVAPTLCEGRANVILEALSHGLPVLTTPNSGCEDLVQENETGWLVPAHDVEALADKLQTCLEAAERLPAMGLAARAAAGRWQFPDFMHCHNAVVRRFMAANGVTPQTGG